MIRHGFYILKLLRPRQWIKNFALFAGITFAGELFNLSLLSQVVSGFIAFCLFASSTYIFNDILDVKKDKLHPFKRLRPIASGEISVPEALVILAAILFGAFAIALNTSILFTVIGVSYIILQILYSTIFKSITIFDILFIATGYILRILAGEAISNFHTSIWLLLTAVSLSLFLAVGKRRSELTLLQNVKGAKIDEVRKTLSHYSEALLDSFSTIFATSTFVFYSLFTFLATPRGLNIGLDLLLPEFLPSYFHRKWLMVTILPVIYGVMRYLQDIYEKKEGESPDKVLLSDRSLLASVIIWGFLVIFIIYFIGG
ncbi:MAG: UbiA prenyltransferase family protein [Candidatus Levybacteria bacterium]|nr:UbiA prenyltransferase family protein [Candidatus Levybacteria bacterium]